MAFNISLIFLLLSGRIKHTEICHLLKEMLPPVGLGHRCLKVLAYKVLETCILISQNKPRLFF